MDGQGGVACWYPPPPTGACSIPLLWGPDRNRGLFQHDETQMAVRETTPDMSQVTF